MAKTIAGYSPFRRIPPSGVPLTGPDSSRWSSVTVTAGTMRVVERQRVWSAAWAAARLIFWTAIPLLVVAAWLNSYVMGDWVHYYDPARPLYVDALSDYGMLS